MLSPPPTAACPSPQTKASDTSPTEVEDARAHVSKKARMKAVDHHSGEKLDEGGDSPMTDATDGAQRMTTCNNHLLGHDAKNPTMEDNPAAAEEFEASDNNPKSDQAATAPVSRKTRMKTGESPSGEKRAVGADASRTDGPDGARRKTSYKELLLGYAAKNSEMEEEPEEPEDFEVYSDSDSDGEDPDCPTIRLSAAEKRRLYRNWRYALIVKVLGKKVGYRFLQNQLHTIWTTSRAFTIADLGNDFYIVRFGCPQDYHNALNGGPWTVADHYLTMRPWKPYFDPYATSIDNV
ncbi:hypothetical protein Tsubulata_044972, partial [Turnera subulata]